MFPRVLANIGDVHGKRANRKSPTLRFQIVCRMRYADFQNFYRSSHEFIKIIQSADLFLLLSGWRVEGDIVYFYNFWTIEPDASTLVQAEFTLPDSPNYAQFADIFLVETKDIAVPINPVRMKPLPLPKPNPGPEGHYSYLRAEYAVRLQDFAEFQAQVEAELVPFALEYGWKLGDIYLGLTGSSTSLVQMWIVPEAQAAGASQKLARAGWQSLVTEPPSYQILNPLPSDPILGSQPIPGPSGGPSLHAVNDYKNRGT